MKPRKPTLTPVQPPRPAEPTPEDHPTSERLETFARLHARLDPNEALLVIGVTRAARCVSLYADPKVADDSRELDAILRLLATAAGLALLGDQVARDEGEG